MGTMLAVVAFCAQVTGYGATAAATAESKFNFATGVHYGIKVNNRHFGCLLSWTIKYAGYCVTGRP